MLSTYNVFIQPIYSFILTNIYKPSTNMSDYTDNFFPIQNLIFKNPWSQEIFFVATLNVILDSEINKTGKTKIFFCYPNQNTYVKILLLKVRNTVELTLVVFLLKTETS